MHFALFDPGIVLGFCKKSNLVIWKGQVSDGAATWNQEVEV